MVAVFRLSGHSAKPGVAGMTFYILASYGLALAYEAGAIGALITAAIVLILLQPIAR